jgi:integrase
VRKQGNEAVGLKEHELSDFISARRKLAECNDTISRAISCYLDAKSKLKEYDKTITDAAEFYVDYLERVRRCKTTVREVASELLEARRKDGRSEVYLRDLRNRLCVFCRDFGSQPLAAVSSRELANWLRNVNGSPVTRANFRRNISVLFGYAVDEGMIDNNPVERVKKPKLVDKPPEIFSVDQIAALLCSANTLAPDVVPMLTIGAFAGLRESEIKRLDWEEVNLQRHYIRSYRPA